MRNAVTSSLSRHIDYKVFFGEHVRLDVLIFFYNRMVFGGISFLFLVNYKIVTIKSSTSRKTLKIDNNINVKNN